MSGHPPCPPRHLLVVDDDEDMSFILERFFRSDVLTVCRSGAECLAVLSRGLLADVLICDLGLPDTDGVTLYVQACAQRPELQGRTLFVSGGVVDEEVGWGLIASGQPVLYKPFSLQQLAEQVAQLHAGESGAAGTTGIR